MILGEEQGEPYGDTYGETLRLDLPLLTSSDWLWPSEICRSMMSFSLELHLIGRGLLGTDLASLSWERVRALVFSTISAKLSILYCRCCNM